MVVGAREPPRASGLAGRRGHGPREPAGALPPVSGAALRALACAAGTWWLGLASATACSSAGAGAEREAPPAEVRITLLATTDLHAHLLPWDYARARPSDGGSLAQLATVVDSVRDADPHVLLFDSGDLLEGTPLADRQAEQRVDGIHPVIVAMNALGYDAAALGNHEFNYGLPFLRASLRPARFPFLSGNAYVAGTDSTAWPAYALLDVAGVRVGVLGLTTPGVQVWDRAHVEGRIRFGDLVAAARRWVPRMREEGAEVIVLLAHAGLGPGSSYGAGTGVPEENPIGRLLRDVPGIDVAFLGHTHAELAGGRIGDALALQAGPHARSLAYAHLTLRRDPGGARVVRTSGGLLPARGAAPATRLVEALRDVHRRTVAWLEEPLSWTPDRWSAQTARVRDTPIADLIQAAQRAATGAELSSTAIFDPSVAFGPGPIVRRHLRALYRYPNTLRAVRIDGSDLRDYLEWSARYYRRWPADPPVNDSVPGFNFDMVSGVEYVLDLSRPVGERVRELRFRGRPVSPADSFTLALNNYRQSGGGAFPAVAGAPVVYEGEETVAELLVAFVAARDTLRRQDLFEENWRLLPPTAVEALLDRTGDGPPR